MLQNTSSPLVIKLRWVMIAAIAASAILTLIGQPENFWRDPGNAVWADGRQIHTTITPSPDLLLGHGAVAFIGAHVVYMIVAFFAVPRVPRLIALTTIFSAIFIHGYDAHMWLVMRFHLGGGGGIAACGSVLGTLLSFAVLPTWQRSREAVNAWRWLMVAVLLVDFANTLLGQPASYWQDPSTMLESNSLTRMFLSRGWMYYLLLDVLLAAGQLALITFLPLPLAFVTVFAFIFGNFAGASNWFLFEWHWGWTAPVVYGAILSTVMVLTAFRNPNHERVPTSV